MSDIFISYASSQRAKAQMFAKALEQQGWTVWWDRNIPPGRTFDQVIEEAIDGAKCLIVLWSEESVASEWVKTEAAEGARRRILVPVLIDEVAIPLEFRRIQAARLVGWQGMVPHPEFDLLVAAVARTLGMEREGRESAVAVPPRSGGGPVDPPAQAGTARAGRLLANLPLESAVPMLKGTECSEASPSKEAGAYAW